MYKSRLQELCQKQQWHLPIYKSVKDEDSPDHASTFSANVVVNGFSFQSVERCKSLKEAQAEAARIAFHHFAVPMELSSNLYSDDESVDTSGGGGPSCNSIGKQIINSPNMYKSRLNELCNKRKWKLPNYKSNKEGPDHIPSFRATVVVNGVSFDTPISSKTAKEAQSEAARIAFLHFTAQRVDPLPRPQQCLSFANGFIGGFNIPPSGEDFLLKSQETQTCSPSANSSDILNVEDCEGSFSDSTGKDIPPINEETQSYTASANSSDILNVKKYEGSFNDYNNIITGEAILSKNQEKSCSAFTNSFDLLNVNEYEDLKASFKSKLQCYTQKRNLSLPVYSCTREGPLNDMRFKGYVTVGGQTFGSSELFRTIKEAENAAAGIALSSLLVGGMQEIDSGFYKNLLQQFISKRGFPLPKYGTVRSGGPHLPSFISTVQIKNKSYEGIAAKTKKQAEINAAKIALDHLKQTSFSDFNVFSTGENVPSKNEETQSYSASANSSDILNVKQYEGSFNDYNNISIGEDIPSKNQEKSCSASTNSFDLLNVNEYEELKASLKSKLQCYTQKRNVNLPVYSCTREEPLKDMRFKAEVTVGGQIFGSSELFHTIKEAENAAAGIALSSLLVGDSQEIDSGFYKILLQQLISKRGFSLPKYGTVRSGDPHSPSFISIVQIENKSYEGVAAKTKKQAELNAAKIALDHLKHSGSPKTLACITPTDQPENLIVPVSLDSTMVSIVNGRSAEQINQDPLTLGPSINVGDEDVNLLAYSTSEDKVIEDGTSLSLPATTCSKLSNLSLTNTSATMSTGPKIRKMVTVLTRKPNMLFPDDANILPYNHDKWVAYEICSSLE